MKISTLQENIKYGLSIVAHIAGKNINLPILNNILIEAKDKEIKLISTNLEIGIISTIRGKIEKEGIFTVNSRIINDYINLLPNKKIIIKQKEKSLLIECDNYKTKIKGEIAEDFPLIPQISKKNFYKTKIKDLKKAISQVIFAVANSEIRMELTGVLFIFADKKLTLASTDSYRLTEKIINIDTNISEKKEIIIPAKTLQELYRILTNIREDKIEEGEDELEIYISDNQILFCFDSIELVSRIIDGQFPDYKQIIPQNTKTEVVIEKDEFVRAIKAAAIFSKQEVNDINIDFPIEKNKTIISSSSGQSGENSSELDCQIKGADNGIVLNYKYLLEGVKNINSEKIKIKVVDGNTPCFLQAEKDDSYFYLIMPIKQ